MQGVISNILESENPVDYIISMATSCRRNSLEKFGDDAAQSSLRNSVNAFINFYQSNRR
jgi:hypothetical protein